MIGDGWKIILNPAQQVTKTDRNKNISLQQELTMHGKLFTAETPSEVEGAQGLLLITQNTPNGQATQILLEELADAYSTRWSTYRVDLSSSEQKKEWFLRLNPNGRIPVIVDKTQSPPFVVIETSAQLLYLVDRLDSGHIFGFTNELEKSEALQWLFFWHGGGAPYLGQLNHFLNVTPETIPCTVSTGATIHPLSLILELLRCNYEICQRNSTCFRCPRDSPLRKVYWRAKRVPCWKRERKIQHS